MTWLAWFLLSDSILFEIFSLLPAGATGQLLSRVLLILHP